MTQEELKKRLKPIVCDLTLTKEERTDKLGTILGEWIHTNRPETEISTLFDQWNSTMVDIVQENNLGRH